MLSSGRKRSSHGEIGYKRKACIRGSRVRNWIKHGMTSWMVWAPIIFVLSRPCVSDQILTTFVAENIRVDGEVIKRLGRQDISVRIPGSEDFIGTLNVYHEIHCLVIDPFACKPVFEPELTFCRNDFINICTSYILPIPWLSLPSSRYTVKQDSKPFGLSLCQALC